MTACESCGAAVEGRYVCAACRSRWRRDATRIVDLASALEDKVRRRVNMSGSSGGGSETPLVYDPDAAAFRDRMRARLAGVIKRVTDESWPRHLWPTGEAVRRTASKLGRVTGHGHVIGDTAALAEQIARAVDKPPALEYLGTCWECDYPIRARPPVPEYVKCRRCGAEWNANGQRDLRAWQRGQALDRIVGVRGLADAATVLLGTEIGYERVKSLVRRAKIAEHVPGRYRVGDLIDYLETTP